ncbi:Cof-type HAD-IIB family hydrolase [Microbacterium sp. T2.11-28]|uniref:Cof-type HAD-IIB family hydrolase n=1 Tax=Microbacterium sp. T2.11-28 TaxID=3041169 RepID=UPI00247797F4|nr:Cof-type HAD-IIB family hydrolase [Microbacterium sp. T2.11-28]CAI9391202.1 Sugar phosphatase YidA [Microbacterium sp. T2.11-28]
MTSPASPSRIVFIDVDGTILEHGTVIAPSTVSAIRAARARGHLVYLCTGRSDGDIHPDVRAIGFDGAITNGGGFATRGGELVLQHTMPREDVERLIRTFEEGGIQYFLQSHEGVFASPGILSLMSGFLRQRAARRAEDLQHLGVDDDDLLDAVLREASDRYRPLAEAPMDAIAKAVFVSERSDSVDHMQAELGERFHVIPGSMPMPGGSNGEISLRGINKGAAILEILDQLGLDAADAVGIGDSWNDVEMFQVCGTSVAMAGADPQLQALADHVTTGVLDDGVHNALVALDLI